MIINSVICILLLEFM